MGIGRKKRRRLDSASKLTWILVKMLTLTASFLWGHAWDGSIFFPFLGTLAASVVLLPPSCWTHTVGCHLAVAPLVSLHQEPLLGGLEGAIKLIWLGD